MRRECEQFEAGTRQCEICNGDADLPQHKINAYRRRWGMENLFEEAEEVSGETLPAVATVERRQPVQGKKRAVARVQRSGGGKRKKCGSCSKPSVVKQASNFLTAAAKFIGDGMKITSAAEQESRLNTCKSCPLYDARKCNACGCVIAAKVKGRLEHCPTYKWVPEVRERRNLSNPKTNLMMHIMPVKGNSNWRWNVSQIAQRKHLFSGRKIVSVSTIKGKESVRQRRGRSFETESLDEVVNEFKKNGMQIDEFLEFPNSSKLREVVSFVPMLEYLQSNDPNEVTFSCHAKSVTHDENSITREWADLQYHVCLDDWDSIKNALEMYSIAGSFRRFGQFRTPGNHRWHYSGTFYWFRHDDVFSKNWRKVDKRFYGTESWPGLMFSADESACLFGDNIGDLYKDHEWKRVRRESQAWDQSRGFK